MESQPKNPEFRNNREKTFTHANSVDPDEMRQNAAFHKSLQNSKQSLGTEVHLNLKSLTCDSLICTMDHPRLTVSNQWEEFISIRRINLSVISPRLLLNEIPALSV